MDKQQWISKDQQALAMDIEKPDDYSDHGIADILESYNENRSPDEIKKIKDKVERNSQIQEAVEAAVSDISKKTIENILDQVKTLSPTEHLLLYLKLPTECNNVGDPLRQPLNPLGSRSEINQTIMWIKTHLEEDPELSLPKQEVYNEYYSFCGPNKIKPLSTADFGKVMKQVYPRVRPRRLGTRGNSRYCYAGLRRRLKLDSPLLPDLSDKPQSSEISCSSADLLSAAWTIVKEWAEHQLGTQFSSMQALACYLVLNMSVGSGTGAANVIATSARNSFKGDFLSSPCNNKHRETQLQLQRKIQQKNDINKEKKRKMQLQPSKIEQKGQTKKCKLQSLHSNSSANTSPTTPTVDDINANLLNGVQPVCDKSLDFTNLQALPDFSSFQKTVTSEEVCEFANEGFKQNGGESGADFVPKQNAVRKLPIPRLSNNINKIISGTSPKRAKNAKYKAIQPKPEPCDIGVYNPQLNSSTVDIRSQQSNYVHYTNKCDKKQKANAKKMTPDGSFKTEIDNDLASLTVDGSDMNLPRERLISISDIDKSALDDYLGTNNSQEHEEELVKYFENKDKTSEPDMSSRLSQLRQLLLTQQNSNITAQPNPEMEFANDSQENGLNLSTMLINSFPSAFTKTTVKSESNHINPLSRKMNEASNCSNILNSSARRRVSFDMVHQDDAVPPSPNTRRKNFNFTPISPGPLSPNGRQSKCSSTTVSPFVSPRNTPVPRCKGNVHNSNISTGLMNVTTLRKPITSSKTNLRIKKETDTHNENDKIVVNSNSETTEASTLIVSTEMPNYLPMSAPASPKLSVKSRNSNLLHKLLNSNNKVMYSPNYSRSQSLNINAQDSLSSEISQLFSSNMSHANLESGCRSQSVPLHQMSVKSNQSVSSPLLTNSYVTTQFPFSGTVNHSMQNDFNDFDSFSTNENINMNKILSTLDTCQNETFLKEKSNKLSLPEPNIFNNVSDINGSLNKNPVEGNAIDFNRDINISHSSPSVLPCLRGLGRSQSIDVDMTSDLSYSIKYNPSRSVPGTPVPCSNSKINLKNYRSYPSTPLTINETFSYNHGQDYLLNGQPIKEKSSPSLEINQNLHFFQNSESNDEIYNVDMFNVNDTNLNCDILMPDNKNNFTFDSSLPDNNFCSKQNVINVLDENFDFKNASNMVHKNE